MSALYAAAAADFLSRAAANRAYDPALPLVFMHIPKTSGTSLAMGIAQTAGVKSSLKGFDRSLFGAFEAFHTMAPEKQSEIHQDGGAIATGLDFFGGHFALSTLQKACPRGQLITFLRDPMIRLLSHWLFWRTQPSEQIMALGEWGQHVRLAQASLIEFLTAPTIACQTDNVALRMLLWPHPLIPANGFIDPAHDTVLRAEALARLQRFTYLDVVENPNLESRLGRWLGKPLRYQRLNETPPLPSPLCLDLQNELTPATMMAFRRNTRLDQTIWTTVAKLHLDADDLERLRTEAILRNTARYAALLTPPPSLHHRLVKRLRHWKAGFHQMASSPTSAIPSKSMAAKG